MSINVILMAGSGKRFSDAGYKKSKPLLPVSGKPMILKAVESMPDADKWVFVVRKEHMEETELVTALKGCANNVKILVDPNPIGQLNSCLVAKKEYYEESPMFVGACDLGMAYDHDKYRKLMKSADMLVFSFTGQLSLKRNPAAWGWIRQDASNRITGVSVKIPISNDPFNDYAITGSFAFRDGKVFTAIADELIKRGVTVNGEYYIDSMIAIAIDLGLKVISFPVKYVGWGVPADYEEYIMSGDDFKARGN